MGDVWAMFKKYPPFLNNSEKKISQTVETLNKCGLTMILKRLPQCIGLSVESVKEKTEFLVKEMTTKGCGFNPCCTWVQPGEENCTKM